MFFCGFVKKNNNLKIQRIQKNLKSAEQQMNSLETELSTLGSSIEAAGGTTITTADINAKMRELENIDRQILTRRCKLRGDPNNDKTLCPPADSPNIVTFL